MFLGLLRVLRMPQDASEEPPQFNRDRSLLFRSLAASLHRGSAPSRGQILYDQTDNTWDGSQGDLLEDFDGRLMRIVYAAITDNGAAHG